MTTKQFFVDTLKDELPRFERVLKALPAGKLNYRPDSRSRTALELINLVGNESGYFPIFLKTGIIDFAKVKHAKLKSTKEAIKAANASFKKTLNLVSKMTEAKWNSGAKMLMGEHVDWKTTRGNMAWGLLLDLIHHRGQLSVYIRPMGGKVPSIYGPSGDSK